MAVYDPSQVYTPTGLGAGRPVRPLKVSQRVRVKKKETTQAKAKPSGRVPLAQQGMGTRFGRRNAT
jgi:hypothetical protein